MRLLVLVAFAAVAGGGDRALPEPLRIALEQTDAYLGQLESEAKIVYQSADRLARPTGSADLESWRALEHASERLRFELATVEERAGAFPSVAAFARSFGELAPALRRLDDAVTARDAARIRDQSARLMTSVAKADARLDALFRTHGLSRIRSLRVLPQPSTFDNRDLLEHAQPLPPMQELEDRHNPLHQAPSPPE